METTHESIIELSQDYKWHSILLKYTASNFEENFSVQLDSNGRFLKEQDSPVS